MVADFTTVLGDHKTPGRPNKNHWKLPEIIWNLHGTPWKASKTPGYPLKFL